MIRRPVAYKKPSLVARLVDRAVAVVSPERGLRRIQARSALGLVQASIGSVTNSGRGGSPKRGAAAKEGTLRNWNPNRINAALEARQREDVVYRALDLEANDPHVNGLVESMSINTVGIGFTAQSRIRADQLTISPEQLTELQKQMEWNWAVWSKEADVREKDHFNDLLAVADRSMLVRGEYLIIPQLVKRPHRIFSFARQIADLFNGRTSPPGKNGWMTCGSTTRKTRSRPYPIRPNMVAGTAKRDTAWEMIMAFLGWDVSWKEWKKSTAAFLRNTSNSSTWSWDLEKRDYKAAGYMLLAPVILSGVGASAATPLLVDDPEGESYAWAERLRRWRVDAPRYGRAGRPRNQPERLAATQLRPAEQNGGSFRGSGCGFGG